MRPNGRSSETRTAFLGLLECAAILQLQQPEAARRLRDRAIEGLVAVGLADVELTRQAVSLCRQALSTAAAEVDQDLIRSCGALLNRIDETLIAPYRGYNQSSSTI